MCQEDDIGQYMANQKLATAQRDFGTFMENARNTMRAVRICIQEGDTEEAERLISEALGEEDGG